MLARNPDQATALLHVGFERCLGCGRNRLHVPVVDRDKLEIVEFGRHAAGRLLHFELVGAQHAKDVLLARGRIARDHEHARTAQRHRILEAGLAQIAGRDLAGQRDGAYAVDAGL